MLASHGRVEITAGGMKTRPTSITRSASLTHAYSHLPPFLHSRNAHSVFEPGIPFGLRLQTATQIYLA